MTSSVIHNFCICNTQRMLYYNTLLFFSDVVVDVLEMQVRIQK
jgi:hypothetical protein